MMGRKFSLTYSGWRFHPEPNNRRKWVSVCCAAWEVQSSFYAKRSLVCTFVSPWKSSFSEQIQAFTTSSSLFSLYVLKCRVACEFQVGIRCSAPNILSSFSPRARADRLSTVEVQFQSGWHAYKRRPAHWGDPAIWHLLCYPSMRPRIKPSRSWCRRSLFKHMNKQSVGVFVLNCYFKITCKCLF